jgi:glycosyltransferase involved in cell wall biosynthesis
MNYIDDVHGVYGNSKFPYKIAKFLAGFYSQAMGIYNAGSVLKTIDLYNLLYINRDKKNIVHFLNGERDIRHLGFFKRRFPNTQFVAAFHKPPAILEQLIPNPAALRHLDGAIGVGENQIAFLRSWLGLDRVAYVPHGVDTHFFKPDPTVKKTNTLLFVGQHLRDFDTFNNTVPTLAEKIKDLKINVVIHPAYAHKILRHKCIHIFTEVRDVQLRHFYQEASLLFLPLLDSTACNSLLEAMACGLPIVTSDVGGNTNYLDRTSNVLVENRDIVGFINETIALIQDESRLKEIGISSRDRAMDFEWRKVGKEINRFYEKLF